MAWSDTKLLLHLDGADEAVVTTDNSPSNHTMSFGGTAELDTAVKKFGLSALLLDGDSDYLSTPDSADWDVVASAADNWTIDLWVKHTDHAGSEPYVSQGVSNDHFWEFLHIHGQGLRFAIEEGGSEILTCSGGEITDTNWHHVAMIKVASNYGVYLDGTQTGHTDDNSFKTLAENLNIGYGNYGNALQYFYGSMDEVRIIHSNPFGGAPNAGKTDTIVVPTRSFSAGKNRGVII